MEQDMWQLLRTSLFLLAILVTGAPAVAQAADPAADARQLIELLENAEARDALIASLKSVAEQGEVSATEEIRISIGRQLADLTQGLFEKTATAFSSAMSEIAGLPAMIAALETEQLDVLWEALKALALVIVVTTAIYVILRRLAQGFYRLMGERAQDLGALRTLSLLVATTFIDFLVVLVAWGLGYVAALYLYGEPGVMGVRQSLYLNAFLLVGVAKVAIRAILSPATGELRFLAISDPAARTMSGWFSTIASVVGYGQMLIVPIVNRQVSFAAGRGVSTILAFVAIAMAAILVMKSRRAVEAWLLGDSPDDRSGMMRFISRLWYVPVQIYLVALALIVAARPDGLIWPVLLSSAQVIAALIAGAVISGLLARLSARGLRLPATIAERMPALERHVNRLLSRILRVAQVFVVAAVVAFALHSAGIFDAVRFFRSDFGVRAVGAFISVSFILLVGAVLWLSLVSWVDYRLNPEYGSAPTTRETTLLTLMRNALSIALFVIVLMFVLAELGVDIAPLIASAGVLGLAIGFGAQKMVQDIITGIFIQFENAINVGDVVTLGGTTGAVEKLTIRSVTLRDVQGAVHVIPFSSVDMVSNYVKDFAYFVCDLGIAYRESVDDGKAAMLEAFEELRQTAHGPSILGDLEWFGVQALGDSAVVLRARIKCEPGKQWAIGRAYNEICKRILDARGIEIPFPHQTIYFGVDRDGTAPPLQLKKVPS